MDALGLPLQQLDDDYLASQEIDGCQHFGVWPLAQAEEACFGTSSWPADVAVPQMSLEFELADPRAVADGAEELRSHGYQLLHDAKREPWGQTVAHLPSPEGVVVGLSYAPSLHPWQRLTHAGGVMPSSGDGGVVEGKGTAVPRMRPTCSARPCFRHGVDTATCLQATRPGRGCGCPPSQGTSSPTTAVRQDDAWPGSRGSEHIWRMRAKHPMSPTPARFGTPSSGSRPSQGDRHARPPGRVQHLRRRDVLDLNPSTARSRYAAGRATLQNALREPIRS